MGRTHSPYIRTFFKDKGNGIDLPELETELKEMKNKENRFTLRPKDEKATFFLFYSGITDRWYFVYGCDIPHITNTRSITEKQIGKICKFYMSNETQLLNVMSYFYSKYFKKEIDLWTLYPLD